MLTKNSPADMLSQLTQGMVPTETKQRLLVSTANRKLGILGQALAQVRESGFGQLEYPHKELCEDAHAS